MEEPEEPEEPAYEPTEEELAARAAIEEALDLRNMGQICHESAALLMSAFKLTSKRTNNFFLFIQYHIEDER